MTTSHDQSQPVFVGRAVELAALTAALESAQRGLGGVVMLAGEPGIGKTRLADALSAHAATQGALVLWGRCYEGAGAPSFWPWVQVLRAYVEASDPDVLRDVLGLGAADLATLVPEIRARLPDAPVAAPIDGEQARFRLFDSLSGALVRAAHARTILVTLDDLHWADIPSLLMLRHLAPALPSARLLVVGTYRESDISREHPLAGLVADLARLDTTHYVALRGLDGGEIADLVAAIAAWSPTGAQLSAMMDATAGNPFFVVQFARLLAQPGGADPAHGAHPITMPPGVRAAILQRAQRLSAACRQLLHAAAVVGREFSLRVLRALRAIPDDQLLDALDEASAAQLISAAPESVGRYRFIHALVRETLYDALPLAERIRHHREVGVVLQALYASAPDPHLSELAHHYYQAAPGGDVAAALAYSVRAAERSDRLLAYEDAALHYTRALQLLDLALTDDLPQRCDLLLALGATHARSGAAERSREHYAQAADLARQSGDPARLAQAALGLAGTVVTPGISEERVIVWLTEALAALGPDDSAIRARLLGRLAMEYRYVPLRERRDTLSAEAVAVAQRLDDPAALAAALQARHFALLAPDTIDPRMAITIELARLADATGNRELLLQSVPWRVADLLDLGHVQAADSAIAEAAQLAAELRQPLYQWYVAMFRAQRALMGGDLQAAELLIAAAQALGDQVQPRVSRIYAAAQLFVLRREQRRLAELESDVVAIYAAYPGMPVFRCFLAQIFLQAGQVDQARTLLTQLCADRCAELPWDQLWLGSMALLAEVCVALGDQRIAALLYELLVPYAHRNVMVGVPICLGAAALYVGQLAELCGDHAAAERHLSDALAINARLGMRLMAERAQAAFLAHQQLALPQAHPHGLTERELATLRLIAAGRSTKEIASALAVSIATVERHITHLYAKIGARSRADATAFALRHQLT